MEVIKYPEKKDWNEILKRPAQETGTLDTVVKQIIEDVKQNGDSALKKYTLKFDKAELTTIAVTSEEIEKAVLTISDDLKNAIDTAIKNIAGFHKAQFPKEVNVETVTGVECWQRPLPISKIGLYIPGGTAPLFSTVLMLGIPAVIAGCREIILCSPPDKNGKLNNAILYAAHCAGISKIFRIGGVQAIAAMAYGTETIPKVFKIFGPGNQYVTAAKQVVSRDAVAIDMPAGPSEVAVVADASSNPVFIASDLLSQAEHGTDSQVVLFTTESSIIDNVLDELEKQLSELPKKEIALESLKHSRIFLLKTVDELLEMVNQYAPEHLIISTDNADEYIDRIENAGSVFVGHYTPESAGDYVSGTNHTLPTHGWATAYSGVNLDSYFKKITFQKITQEGLSKIGPAIEIMAETEELLAHKRAVSLRLKK